MSISEITAFLASVNYACLVVTLSGVKHKYGPGQEQWDLALRDMSNEQQEAISKRIVHWREASHV